MNTIYIMNFDDVNDPVKTEETIFNQLWELKDTINTDYVYVVFPWAFSINHHGIVHTQKLIDQICTQHCDKKMFFVCQHILVNKLNFHGNLVFTPHATILDSYVPIPHYSCNYELELVKPWDEREYEFSFIGSFRTHPVRQKLYEFFKARKDCLIVDTGSWHFEASEKKQEINARKYIEILGNTKYSLCPRGTGPSTIRIWESMAMGSCPVIVSDYLKMPLERELDSTMWLRVLEKCDNIRDIDFCFDNEEYWEWFSNENLYRSILSALRDKK